MNERYEAWNAALIEEYFPPGNHGRLAYLPVDDDELVAMAEPYELAAASAAVGDFVAAVRAELRPAGSFARFRALLAGWRRVRAEPPYVAALALCVLAAARMASDPQAHIASSNYYTQLNRLLGRGDRDGQPAGFDTLGAVWDDLASWLEADCHRERGGSTIRTSPARRHIGYPLSQCLLRAADRRRLPDFFRAAGLQPQSDISEERLFALLRAWASQPGCGISSHGREAIATAIDIDRHEIAETVARELASWDGELRDARGRRRADIRLFMRAERGRRGATLQLIAERPEGFPPTDTFADAHGRAFEVAAAPGSVPYYRPLPVQVRATTLRSGLSLTNGNLALRLDGELLHVFHETFEPLSGWLSARQVRLAEPAVLLADASVVPQLERLLDEVSPTWTHWKLQDLPSGWLAYSNVRVMSTPERALSPELGKLAPRLFASTSLLGGLRVGPRLWLTGAEPTLAVTVGAAEPAELSLDATVLCDLGPGVHTIPLAGKPASTGSHEISVSGERRHFSTCDTLGEIVPSGSGTLAHVLELAGQVTSPQRAMAAEVDGLPKASEVRVSGASISGGDALARALRPPVLVSRHASSCLLIGAVPTELQEEHRPAEPEWLARAAPDVAFQFYEVVPEFAAQLVIEYGGSEPHVRLACSEPLPPVAAAAEPSPSSAWAGRILAAKEDGARAVGAAAQIWPAYVARAMELTGLAV